MKTRNAIGLGLVVLSFIALIPGLTRDLVTITASFTLLGNTTELFADTRSIIGTARGLHESGNDFVAGLILLFSVIVPFVKGALLVVALVLRDPLRRWQLGRFVASISKWAMADVFVVGVYVAFLSARATDGLDAQLHEGFYWFTAYCLISLASTQFLRFDAPDSLEKATRG